MAFYILLGGLVAIIFVMYLEFFHADMPYEDSPYDIDPYNFPSEGSTMSNQTIEEGDTVEITNDKELHRSYDVGDKAVVNSIEGQDLWLEMKKTGFMQRVSRDYVKLISKGDDSEQEFEVGDRVRLYRKQHGHSKTAEFDVGYEGEITMEPSYDDALDDETANVRLDNQWYVAIDDLELISKGSGTMKDVSEIEAITVTGDDDLKQKLVEIAKGHGYSGTAIESPHFYKNGYYKDESDKIIKESYGIWTGSREPSEDKRETLELPQDWERAKQFVTQVTEQAPDVAISSFDVEFNDDSIEIGCVTFTNEELEVVDKFYKKAKEHSVMKELTYDKITTVTDYQLDK